MGIAAFKRPLSIVGALALFVLGAGQAAAGSCNAEINFYLVFNQGNLDLALTPPGTGTAAYVDSPALSKAGGNPWREIGEWESYIGSSNGGGTACLFAGFSPLNVWLGLRNSDDQGTNFDLLAEVLVNDTVIASGERDCIKGLTRNPALAQEITQGIFLKPTPPSLDGGISLRLSARIGTGPSCTGHSSATGLRVYYNSADRDSFFDVIITGGT